MSSTVQHAELMEVLTAILDELMDKRDNVATATGTVESLVYTAPVHTSKELIDEFFRTQPAGVEIPAYAEELFPDQTAERKVLERLAVLEERMSVMENTTLFSSPRGTIPNPNRWQVVN